MLLSPLVWASIETAFNLVKLRTYLLEDTSDLSGHKTTSTSVALNGSDLPLLFKGGKGIVSKELSIITFLLLACTGGERKRGDCFG